MKRRYRNYTKEFKLEACNLVIQDGLSTTVVAKQFGIHPGMLSRWVNELETYGDQAFVGTGNLRSEDAKLKKLEQENERLKRENEILKKAAAYFAQHPELK